MNPQLAKAILAFARAFAPVVVSALRTELRGRNLEEAIETQKLAIELIDKNPALPEDKKNEILIRASSVLIGVRPKTAPES